MLCRCALSSFLLLLVTGCQREASASPTRDTADPLAAVQLDGGKRWPVDDHTQKSLAAMQAAVQAAAADQSPARTRALAQQLQGLADELIGGCKLTGPAHDAFHAYLGVLLPGFHRMAGEGAAQAQQARAEVAAVLGRFGEFFQ